MWSSNDISNNLAAALIFLIMAMSDELALIWLDAIGCKSDREDYLT